LKQYPELQFESLEHAAPPAEYPGHVDLLGGGPLLQ
jgi:hypothetical protein